METIRTNETFFTKQELGTVIFSLALTVMMVGLMIFGYTYNYSETGAGQTEIAQQTITSTPE